MRFVCVGFTATRSLSDTSLASLLPEAALAFACVCVRDCRARRIRGSGRPFYADTGSLCVVVVRAM